MIPIAYGGSTKEGEVSFSAGIDEGFRPDLVIAPVIVERDAREMGAVSEPIQFHGVAGLMEPGSVEYVLDQLCKDAGVQVCLQPLFFSATRTGKHVTSVTLHDHGGNHEVRAKAFVDASGEGDLAFFGGASVRYGNHGTVQTGTLSMRLGGITADADLSPTPWTAAIQQAKQRGG